jgi:hypothetical protein
MEHAGIESVYCRYMSTAVPAASTVADPHLRTARRVFLGALIYTGALTLFWLVLLVLGPERAPAP